ncbi:hypothetical protein D3C81_1071980 [compost metagenome]
MGTTGSGKQTSPPTAATLRCRNTCNPMHRANTCTMAAVSFIWMATSTSNVWTANCNSGVSSTRSCKTLGNHRWSTMSKVLGAPATNSHRCGRSRSLPGAWATLTRRSRQSNWRWQGVFVASMPRACAVCTSKGNRHLRCCSTPCSAWPHKPRQRHWAATRHKACSNAFITAPHLSNPQHVGYCKPTPACRPRLPGACWRP